MAARMAGEDVNVGRKARAGLLRGMSLETRNSLIFWVLVLPALLWFLLLTAWPLVDMFRISFLNWKSFTSPRIFVGLENYVRMLSDRNFHQAFKNTAIYILAATPGPILVGFVLAFFLSRRPTGQRVLRLLFFSPHMMPLAGKAMMFSAIFLPKGVLNYLLTAVGLESLTRVWLGNTTTVLWSIIAIEWWTGVGWFAVVLAAALSDIPEELYEAAFLDGASKWATMWRIAFPLAFDFIGLMVLLQFIHTLGTAGLVLLLTGGGPGNHSLTLGYYLYEGAFRTRQIGYSQAIGVFTFVIGMLGMLVIRSATRRRYS